MAYDPGLAHRVRSVLERTCAFAEKKMFGGLAFMVNGQMCCGVLKQDLVLRLGTEGAAAALRQNHTRPMDFTGRPMKSMLYVEPAGVDTDDALERWLLLAVRLAQNGPARPQSRSRPGRTAAG